MGRGSGIARLQDGTDSFSLPANYYIPAHLSPSFGYASRRVEIQCRSMYIDKTSPTVKMSTIYRRDTCPPRFRLSHSSRLSPTPEAHRYLPTCPFCRHRHPTQSRLIHPPETPSPLLGRSLLPFRIAASLREHILLRVLDQESVPPYGRADSASMPETVGVQPTPGREIE